MRCVVSSFALTAAFDNLQQARGAGSERSDLRLEIATTFIMTANICQYQSHYVLIEFAVSNQPDWWNTQALAIDIRGQAHRPRRSAANVCMVRAVSDIEKTVGSGQWAVGSKRG